MRTPLLTKGANFTQVYEGVVLRIQSIRKKNDQYQRLSASQIDSIMAQEIIEQKTILDRQIDQTKNIIDQMQKIFKQLPQKNKLKQLKKQYEKQLNRYKQISQSLMEKSVIKAQMRNSYRKSLPDKNNKTQARNRQVGGKRQSVQHVAQQQQLDIDYTMEQNILMQRKQELGKVQQHMQRVYQIQQDQSRMVNQQGNMIDIIGQEMLKADGNVEAVNQQLIQASIQQKKSRKKCYILIFIVLFVIFLLGGAYFVLGS